MNARMIFSHTSIMEGAFLVGLNGKNLRRLYALFAEVATC
jgi:hypothetical protein